MKIACWSGPRNISTALMRSWSSRKDTEVLDEPFYSYYLKKTKLEHPLSREIIKKYPSNYEQVVKLVCSSVPNHKKIWYQKQMAHHIFKDDDIKFIRNFKNCFLIRHPKKVISSFTKKNELTDTNQLGYIQQNRIINFLNEFGEKIIVIDSEVLLKNPKNILQKWCAELNIEFDSNMLTWKKGIHKSDGIWAKHWYNSVISTKNFEDNISENPIVNEKYSKILDECMVYYEQMKVAALK